MTMLDFLENDYATYQLVDNILIVTYKDVSLDLAAATKVVEDRLLIQQGKRYAVLCEIRKVRDINKQARDYLAVEGSVLLKAVAFIAENPVSKIFSKFYLRTSQPTIPYKIFKERDKAIAYLKSI